MPSISRPSDVKGVGGLIGAAVGGLAFLLLAFGSFFVVSPSHLAYTVRWGTVTTQSPLQPGLHFKFPLIEDVNEIKVAKDTLVLQPTQFFTKDVQYVTVQLGITYDVPAEAVHNLLYQTGAAGSTQAVEQNISRIIIDRVRSVISRYDITTAVGPDRENVISQVKAVVSDEMKSVFDLHVIDVQLPLFQPSDTYMHGVENAVKIRNDQLASTLNRDKAKIDAETLQVTATASANAAVEKARGERDAAIHAAEATAAERRLNGEGEASAIIARGNAEAEAIAAKIKAAGGGEFYVRQLQAQAALNWKGDVPTMVTGGPQTYMQIPAPVLAK